MGSHSGDELQIIHPLRLFFVLPISVADFPFLFIEEEAFQGQKRTAHVLAHSLGLSFCFSSDAAVDRESRTAPGEKARSPFATQELLRDKVDQDFFGEENLEPRIIDEGDLMENTCFIHSAHGHQEMEAGMEIDVLAKGLNDCDDSRHETSLRDNLKRANQGAKSWLAE